MVKNRLDNLELRSEDVQEILVKVPHWMIRWGSILLMLLTLTILLLSWMIKYPDVILAKAIITTESPPQREYARITGKIDSLFVYDNQSVTVDEVLAALENTANIEDVFHLKSIIDTIKINTTSFSFPIDKIPVFFLGELEADYALFENNYLLYLINKEMQPFSNEAITKKYSLVELKSRLSSLASQKELHKLELDIAIKKLDRNKILFEKGVISELNYENKQQEYLQIEQSFKNRNISLSQLRETISNANMFLSGTEISKAREEIILLKKVIQSFNQLKNSIKKWESKYILKSNMNGKVSFHNYWVKNQIVNQGNPLFTIIPEDNINFIAKLTSPVQNSGKIRVGQTVNIKIENYPEIEFGILVGKVRGISIIPNDKGLYLISVSLPNKLITSYNKELEFKYEMVGSAEIITEDLRLLERFFYQLKNIANH